MENTAEISVIYDLQTKILLIVYIELIVDNKIILFRFHRVV